MSISTRAIRMSYVIFKHFCRIRMKDDKETHTKSARKRIEFVKAEWESPEPITIKIRNDEDLLNE